MKLNTAATILINLAMLIPITLVVILAVVAYKDLTAEAK
jgi:hypothetical protein